MGAYKTEGVATRRYSNLAEVIYERELLLASNDNKNAKFDRECVTSCACAAELMNYSQHDSVYVSVVRRVASCQLWVRGVVRMEF